MDDLDLERLKPITEHFLQDVKASDRLKNQTFAKISLESCGPSPAWRRAFVRGSAAALVLMGGLFLFGSMRDSFTNGTQNPETIEMAPIGSEISPISSNRMPEHVPERFALLEKEQDPERNGEWSTLRYSAPNGSLVLMRSGEAWPAGEGFSSIAIVPDGDAAKAASPGSVKQLPDGTLDLRWQSKIYHYRITGMVSLEEALAIAGSLTSL